MKKDNFFILGGGITGLVAGWTSRLPVFEAESTPGGICSSYYICPPGRRYTGKVLSNKDAYRFEIGGGHWIFGSDQKVLRFIRKFISLRTYQRHSSVYFSKKNLYIPYPLQNNLRFLEKKVAAKALEEIVNSPEGLPATMKEWLGQNFGLTLCELFFYPFHLLYTANLYEQIAPQDNYKSPVDISKVRRGARRKVSPVGYNVTFTYPTGGLNALAQAIAGDCNIQYRKKVIKIDVKRREIYFADGNATSYRTLLSTLPLNKMMDITGLKINVRPDPYSSVLVLNIGAVRGESCPFEHWLYIPDSEAGFHRVGFYSNVDTSFVPRSSQKANNRVGIYVERAYIGGQKPSPYQIKAYSNSVIRELQSWGFIREAEVVDPTWIDVAYTWKWPGSLWREQALSLLKEHSIYQLGRYGNWKFQGIADSIKEGLEIRNNLKLQ